MNAKEKLVAELERRISNASDDEIRQAIVDIEGDRLMYERKSWGRLLRSVLQDRQAARAS